METETSGTVSPPLPRNAAYGEKQDEETTHNRMTHQVVVPAQHQPALRGIPSLRQAKLPRDIHTRRLFDTEELKMVNGEERGHGEHLGMYETSTPVACLTPRSSPV